MDFVSRSLVVGDVPLSTRSDKAILVSVSSIWWAAGFGGIEMTGFQEISSHREFLSRCSKPASLYEFLARVSHRSLQGNGAAGGVRIVGLSGIHDRVALPWM